MNKATADKIFKKLRDAYPRVTTALEHKTPFELLVATILSAQCTDARVNMVTKELFKKYRSAGDYAGLEPSLLEEHIKSTGFYRNKARNIISASKKIIDEYKGRVPDTMEDLIGLPGVARKTANIVLLHGYGIVDGIAVDTHVKRVSNRLGFTDNKDPVKIEKDLMGLFDKKKWGLISNTLIAHGRKICDARKPNCEDCPVCGLCLSAHGCKKGVRG